MWSLLNAADQELRQVALPPEAAPRLQHLLETVRADLERSVSPALAGELRHLTHWPAGPRGLDELRVESVSLLGWTGGLVLAMLGQFEAARPHRFTGRFRRSAIDSLLPCRHPGKKLAAYREVPGHTRLRRPTVSAVAASTLGR